MSTIVDVDKSLIEQAISHSKNRLGFEYDRFHLATEQRLSMITLGTVGQLIFKKFLEDKKVDFKFQLQYGKYDDYDFELYDKIVEVKTSGYKLDSEWQKLNGIYNSSQLEQAIARGYFCTVQIFVNGYDKVNKLFNTKRCTQGVIAGWLEIEKLPEFPTRYLPFGKATLIPLDKLKNIETLISP